MLKIELRYTTQELHSNHNGSEYASIRRPVARGLLNTPHTTATAKISMQLKKTHQKHNSEILSPKTLHMRFDHWKRSRSETLIKAHIPSLKSWFKSVSAGGGYIEVVAARTLHCGQCSLHDVGYESENGLQNKANRLQRFFEPGLDSIDGVVEVADIGLTNVWGSLSLIACNPKLRKPHARTAIETALLEFRSPFTFDIHLR